MEVLNAKRKINNFWDQKLKPGTIVFFKQHRNVKRNGIFNEGIQNKKAADSAQISRSHQILWKWKKKQIKNGGGGGGGGGGTLK